MILLEYDKHQQYFPEKWEELTPKQLVKCIGILEAYNLVEAQLLIMNELSNKKFKRILATIGQRAVLTNEISDFYAVQLNEFRKCCDFMLTPPSFDKWNFTKLRIGLVNYYGPTDVLANITFGEFGRAEHYYNQYVKTQSIDSLHKFLACLFRPKKYIWFGKRKPYSELEIDNYKKFARISLPVKRAIVLNFSATRENVFGRFKDGFSKGQQSEADKYGWDGVILSLSAERHMLPDVIRQRPLIEMLVEFDTIAIRNREQNEKNND